MSLDPYTPCPCGSGKKFKWCCQEIYGGIQRAWQQEENGQHEVALHTLDEVVQQHSNNPEAWGQKALLLANRGQVEQAEEALEKAFALNSNYPFGLRLRAQFRHAEGEFQGALLLARKAADAYDPAAGDALAEVYGLIFDCEMRCNRPVAARAALQRAVRLAPANEELRTALENIFGPKSRFPQSASKVYEFRKPADGVAGASRQAWNRALTGAEARLGDLAKAFEELTTQNAADAPAWFNLGLCRAWLGDHPAALAALDRYLELEPEEAPAVEAAVLSEILRFGYGMEDQCDYNEHSFLYDITNPQPVQALLEEWLTQRRLVPMQTDQQGLFAGIVLELTPTGLVTVGRPAADNGRMAGNLIIVGPTLRFASVIKERFDRVKEEFRQKLSLGLTDLRDRHGVAPFHEILSEALVFPLGETTDEGRWQQVVEHARRYFEDTWIHRPLKSLNSIAPVDASGHGKLRKKLLGVIRLMEECSRLGVLARYSFDDLRRKLGLLGTTPAATTAASGIGDPSAMGAAELAALKSETLSDEQLEKAYQAAYRLDAQELASHFARALVARPVKPGRTDRYPWFSYLIAHALRNDEQDAALDHVNEGQKSDCEHNEGRRRNDYELFRAQVHVRRGEVEQAEDVYRRLIERVPRDFKVRGKAAEAMLGLKDATRALAFAEEGVKAARQANDRDSEQYLLELSEAARRQLR